MTRDSSRSRSRRHYQRRPSEANCQITFGVGTEHDFTQPQPIPQKGQQRVQELMQSGRLFRYQDVSDVADLERKFSAYIGRPYTMACNSGGCGLFLALRALGVKHGMKVLINAWTLAPVPGAVVHAGGLPVFVDCDEESLVIDVDDLKKKALETGAKVLVVSYMRGQVPNMDYLMMVIKELGLKVVEDCAHTLGATWRAEGETARRHLGTFGDIGVWSLQTNKTINCGEGGLISTSDQDIASFLTVATGSYGHFDKNGSSGDPTHTQSVYNNVPNMSMRMTAIAAALAIAQLEELDQKLEVWRGHATILRKMFTECPYTRVPKHRAYTFGKEYVVWSSIQFELLDFTKDQVQAVIDRLARIGIPVAWFGGPCKGFTSTLKDWKFAADADATRVQDCPNAHRRILRNLLDLPLYHTAGWSTATIEHLAQVLNDTICQVAVPGEETS